MKKIFHTVFDGHFRVPVGSVLGRLRREYSRGTDEQQQQKRQSGAFHSFTSQTSY
jgi:hypothetical protein